MVDVWSFATGFLFVFDNVEIQFDFRTWWNDVGDIQRNLSGICVFFTFE